MKGLLGPLVAFLAAYWLTGWFRRHAIAIRMLDRPNARSSHTLATPRGGGIAIFLAIAVSFPLLGMLGTLSWAAVLSFVGSGAIVALIGFADDMNHIRRRWRLLGHAVGAAILLVWLRGFPPLSGAVEIGPFGSVIGAGYLIWLMNLTNFMDGIDGLASVEAITVSLSGALLYLVTAPGTEHWVAPTVLAAATLGFLLWNWPPARIFLGDAGSGFLGLALGAFSLQAARVDSSLFWSWVILLGVFIVDATLTLLGRVARGERFYEAHRSHAYQHATQRWNSHRAVTVTVGATNLCWLLPIALFVALHVLDPFAGLILAYAPLVGAAFVLQAGKPAASLPQHDHHRDE